MKLRKITSLTALLSFILLVLTSVILYIVPQGRIAYWSDWMLWGLDKTQWGSLHINLGILFLLSVFLHIFYNWKPMMFYLKDRTRQFRLFTADFNAALIITMLVGLGTYADLPPFSTIINFSENIKDKAARFYGEPPYGHAELSSLKTFTEKTKLDLQNSIEKLQKSGIKVENDHQTIQDISKKNLISAQQLYELMKPFEEPPGEVKRLPETPPGGFGRRTLADICHDYDLNIKIVMRNLADLGYSTNEQMTFKDAAADLGLDPYAFYDIFKNAAQEK